MPGVSPELEILIKAQADRALREIDQVNLGLERVKKQIGAVNQRASKDKRFFQSLDQMGKASQKAAKYIGLPAIALGVAAVKAAGSMERQREEYAVLLGDVERGKELYDDIIETTASTPLQLEDVNRATSTLLAFGESAESVIETVRTLGDASRGQGQVLNQVAQAYGKILTTNKALREDLNRFVTNGIPIFEELSRVLGVTRTELEEMITAGEVSGQDVTRAFEAMTNEGGRFFGLMEKASQTFEGRLSTTIDALKLTAASIGEALLPVANEFLGWVQSTLAEITAWNERTDGGIISIGKWALGIAAAAKALHVLNAAIQVLKLANPILLAVSASVAAVAGVVYIANRNASRRSKEEVEQAYTRIQSVYEEHIATSGDVVEAVKEISALTGESAEDVLGIVSQIREVSEEEKNAILALEGAGSGNRDAQQNFLQVNKIAASIVREVELMASYGESVEEQWNRISSEYISQTHHTLIDTREELNAMVLAQSDLSDGLRSYIELQSESLAVQQGLNDQSDVLNGAYRPEQIVEAEQEKDKDPVKANPIVEARLEAEKQYYSQIEVLKDRLIDGDITQLELLGEQVSVIEAYRDTLYDLGYNERLRADISNELLEGSKALVLTAEELLVLEQQIADIELAGHYSNAKDELTDYFKVAKRDLEIYTRLASQAAVELEGLRVRQNAGAGGLDAEIELQRLILEQAYARVEAAEKLLGIHQEQTHEMEEQRKATTSISSSIGNIGDPFGGVISGITSALDNFYEVDIATNSLAAKTDATWQDKIRGITQLVSVGAEAISGLVEQSFSAHMERVESELAALQEEIDEEKDSQAEQIEYLDAIGADSVAWQIENNEQIKKSEDELAQKRKQAHIEGFQQKKSAAMADALLGGALALINALASPFPLNIALPITIGIATAAQIAAIASQQAPALERGGIVPAQPPYGGLYRVGEKQAEAVIPLDRFGPTRRSTTIINYYYDSTTVQGSVIEADVGRQLDTAIQEKKIQESLLYV